ncbi:MAG: DNA-directed RNA polymerase subunit alpha [Chlorobi bacterium]|nr:DNA-directed RNA polymerase subunit alpha [Chlorobiota bacterium]
MTMNLIQMPDGIVLDEASYSTTYGRFIIQPLEKGYGVTIGNSFRRILLSSLPGSAIIGVKIENVLHEFSTIEGVVEDVAEIVLNLKEVRLKPINDKANRIVVPVKGPGELTSADIQKASSEFEILNLDKHIATLSEGVDLEMELWIGRGKGYVPADENTIPDAPVGMISIDAIYTPIVNVKYLVENTRVGQSTDYDKLTLEITTDGSITPEDALTQAARVLMDHVQLFLNFDMSLKEGKPEPEEDSETEKLKKILNTSVDSLELSVRSHNCLKAANIKTLGELVRHQESDMLKYRNFGRKSLAELGEIIAAHGLTWGMDVDQYLTEDVS